MLMNIKERAYRIATMWGVGERFGGSFIATLFAIPALFLLRAGYWLNPTVFYVVMLAALLASALIIYLALYHESDRDPSVIVLDKFWAFIIVFVQIPFSVKLFVVGFLLLHLFRFFLPMLSYRLWNINFYEFPLRMFNAVVAGCVLNIFFRLVLWLGS